MSGWPINCHLRGEPEEEEDSEQRLLCAWTKALAGAAGASELWNWGGTASSSGPIPGFLFISVFPSFARQILLLDTPIPSTNQHQTQFFLSATPALAKTAF